MKTLVLAATALLLAGSFTAEAQRPTNPDGTPVTRSGGGTRPTGQTGGQTGTRPTPAVTPAPVVVRPAPAQVKVFVPVLAPPVVAFNRGEHRYPQRNHRVCQQKSHQLHSYERHAADDGYLSGRERRTIASLKSDLDRTCGGHRWGG
jgi:hypothetical protein